MEYRITDTKQLSLLLESFRRHRQMTQAELGSRLNIAQQSYARIVANPGATSVKTLLEILSALNVELVLHEKSGVKPFDPLHSQVSQVDPTRLRSVLSKIAQKPKSTPVYSAEEKKQPPKTLQEAIFGEAAATHPRSGGPKLSHSIRKKGW